MVNEIDYSAVEISGVIKAKGVVGEGKVNNDGRSRDLAIMQRVIFSVLTRVLQSFLSFALVLFRIIF